MKNVWDKIIAEAKQVSLENEERDLLLSQIKAHIASHPVHIPKKDIIESSYAYRFRLALSWHEKRFVPLAVILILVLFGGTSFAANYALPGETLYSMKVNVNEQVESWMALSPNANARFEAVKAERRLKEAEKLTVKKKKITPKAKAQIKENFAKNAQNVKKIVAEIEASGDTTQAAEVKAEFENKLEAHAVVLSKLASNEDTLVEIDEAGKEDIKEIHALVDEHITELKTTEAAKDTQNTITTEAQKPAEVVTPITEVTTVSPSPDATEPAKQEIKEEVQIDTKASLRSVEISTQSISQEKKKSDKEEVKKKTEKGEEKKKEINEKIEKEVKNILKELELQTKEDIK
ncbi:MAG: hypothetical protein ACK4FA_00270 [Candidatus Paceibacteria bacterium]